MFRFRCRSPAVLCHGQPGSGVAFVLRKAYTDGSTMSTSMGMEAISFSEQATAARRDYFTGSNSGVGGPPVPGITSRSEASTSEWGPDLDELGYSDRTYSTGVSVQL